MTAEQRLATELLPVKLTARDFRLLAEAGAFECYARTELIEGEIWAVNSIQRWHSRVNFEFARAIKEGLEAAGLELIVYGPGSVAMSNHSVPEPDISVAENEPDGKDYIRLGAVRIAVELSDTTRKFDLGRKARLYARHGVPEYWVADREKQTVFRHSAPGPVGYGEIDEIAFEESIVSATVSGLTVSTRSLLG